MSGLVLGIRLVLAAVFAVAGVAKLADLDGSRRALRGFRVPARVANVGGVALPLVELAIAACLFVPVLAWHGLVAAAALLALFATAIGVSMVRGATPDCHCFGQLHSAPAGWRALVRDGVLVAVAVVALAGGRGASRLSAVAWLRSLSAAELVLIVVATALAVAVVALAWFLVELLRQHGRILVRMEALEAAPPSALSPAVTAARTNCGQPANGNSYRVGLPVGGPAPSFELQALDGQPVSLATLQARGLPVVLVFSDPGCGPCNALLPDVARWQREHHARLTIALISRSGLDRNRAKAQEHELRDVVVQEDREVSNLYRAYGTPAGVLISVDGRIASALAQGAPSITELVQEGAVGGLRVIPARATGSRPPQPPPPAGLVVGSQAPALSWENLDGRRISLLSLRGAPVVLLFWNPGCGFCQTMLPELTQWEAGQRPGAPTLVVVSRGDPASNRAMGLRSQIVLEQDFSSARSFGASGTPSAILIDPTGRIAAPIAVGAPGVLSLLRSPQPYPADVTESARAQDHAVRA